MPRYKARFRVISVGLQSAVFHRRESECDKNRGPPAEALDRRSCRWTPVSPVLICKENPYHRGLPFPTCLCSGLMWGTKESFAANNLQSGQNLSGCSLCWNRQVCKKIRVLSSPHRREVSDLYARLPLPTYLESPTPPFAPHPPTKNYKCEWKT